MKKRFLFICLALVLIAAIVAPVSVGASSPADFAAKRFNVTLTPTSIDDTVLGSTWPVRDTATTNVWPVVNLVNNAPTVTGWIIEGRSIYGASSGDLNGNFTFTYGGVLDVLQSGSMQGIMSLQAGGLNNVYLSGDGDIEAAVKDYYAFIEIQGWCAMVPPPQGPIPVDCFFAAVYSNPALVGLPVEVLQGLYGTELPLLPKTLTAEFSGTAKIESGTGTYTGARGRGQFATPKNKPLILHVYPNQHVYQIEGSIKLTGTYIKQTPRKLGNIDPDKLKAAIDSLRDRFGK